MKFRVKIYCTAAFLALLLVAGIIVFFVQAKPAKSSPAKPDQVDISSRKKAEQRRHIQLERYSRNLENTQDFSTNFNAGELAGALNDCAVKIFKAVLPEKSALQMPLDIELINEYSARVSGKAVLFADGKKQEKHLQCQVIINFLANSSCQAEYPEFFEIR